MTLLSYAFRPFFLLNGLFAAAAITCWTLVLFGMGPTFIAANPIAWHGHEMLVGFAMTAVAGFVMTAVAVWTGRPALKGALLAWLLLSWLIGRMVMLMVGILPAWAVGIGDSWFPIMLFTLVSREVLASQNRRNYVIAAIVGLLAVLNVFYHLGQEKIFLYLMIHVVLVLISIIGGRIIPSFTANWLRLQGASKLPVNNVPLDIATISMTLLSGVGLSLAPLHILTAWAAVATGILHALRMSAWCGWSVRSNPLLLILHVAYAWLPIGYVLSGLTALGLAVPATAGLHALTMGAIGTMIFAMTTRVSLGHTGRPLQAARLTVCAYLALSIAVIVRVMAPFLAASYHSMLVISATGWVLAFLLFVLVYWPILSKERETP